MTTEPHRAFEIERKYDVAWDAVVPTEFAEAGLASSAEGRKIAIAPLSLD